MARLGGDEFVVLTTNSEPDMAMGVAERVVEVVSQPLAMPDGLSAIGASVGVAHARGPHVDLEALLRQADEAMYRAKRGRQGPGQRSPAVAGPGRAAERKRSPAVAGRGERLPCRPMLRVATWNVWGRFGPWERRFEAVVASLAALEADVVCLQEVWFGRDGSHQAPLLADALGWPTWAAAPIELGSLPIDVGVTNAVLSRWPLVAEHADMLPGPGGRTSLRSVVHARLAHPAAEIDVFTTHLDHRPDASATRQAQVRTVAVVRGRAPLRAHHVVPARPDR